MTPELAQNLTAHTSAALSRHLPSCRQDVSAGSAAADCRLGSPMLALGKGQLVPSHWCGAQEGSSRLAGRRRAQGSQGGLGTARMLVPPARTSDHRGRWKRLGQDLWDEGCEGPGTCHQQQKQRTQWGSAWRTPSAGSLPMRQDGLPAGGPHPAHGLEVDARGDPGPHGLKGAQTELGKGLRLREDRGYLGAGLPRALENLGQQGHPTGLGSPGGAGPRLVDLCGAVRSSKVVDGP